MKRMIWGAMLLLSVAAAVCFSAGGIRYALTVTAGTVEGETCIVIDPGHGGEDGGAVGINGVNESRLNLEISLRLRDLFSLLGVKSVMLRETDTALYTEDCATIREKKVSDIKQRVKLVNDTPNALLVSIHQNYFEQSKYDGAQVFYAKTDGSHDLAERTQDILRQTLDRSNRRQCKPSQTVYLMEHVRCTAILVECGFLSNPTEAELLCSEAYQKKLAAAICAGVYGYLTEEESRYEV